MKDDDEKSIIKKLLEKDPKNRINDEKVKDIKGSKYFEGFRWDDLAEGKINGPYIPKRFKNKK